MSDTASHGKKRRKNFYVGTPKGGKRQKWSNLLDSGSGHGFLLTINPKQERRATLTAYSLLNEATDRLYGKQETPSQETDSEHPAAGDDIEAELKTLREQNYRFNKLRTEIPSIIFISTKLPKPQEISTDVYEHMPSTIQHIVRFVPVLATCKTQPECVSKKVLEVLEEQFPVVLQKIAFLVQLKARHNNEYNSSDARRAFCLDLATKIKEWNCDFVPELKEPELVINIDILQKVCCISLLPHFARFKKYNPEQFNVAPLTQLSKAGENDQDKPVKTDTESGKDVADNTKQQNNSVDATVVPKDLSPGDSAAGDSKDSGEDCDDSREKTAPA